MPAAERELVAVLHEDKRADRRAAAAFLLAHLASGERVVELMLPSITDPSELVRNNAMHVLSLIAIDHPEVPIPVAPILEALRFPSTTDRNKASTASRAARRARRDARADPRHRRRDPRRYARAQAAEQP